MEALARSLAERLDAKRPFSDLLETVGAPEPERAGHEIARAAAEPDLAPHRDLWLPSLLHGARPGFGAQVLADLAGRYRGQTGDSLAPDGLRALARVVASSDFLARLLLRHPDWTRELAGDPPPPPEVEVDADWTAIRLAKYRGLLRITARDLLGRPMDESLTELSDLADRCLRAALDCAAARVGTGAVPSLLALGKLGGRELNYASDVDVLFLYATPDGADDLDLFDRAARVIREFKRHLEAPSEDGFGYRVDLDLRPEGRSGALANSVEAALDYYESFGADWERQMLIRLRPLAGPAEPAEAFERDVAPFVYRRLIDPDAIRSVRRMKDRIELERRAAGKNLEWELKEGPGGIRDVEFLVQALQLFLGGEHPELRCGNVLVALDRLQAGGFLPGPIATSLADAYAWLRRAEHGVQQAEERQTHRFPQDPSAQLALARRMGYAQPRGTDAREALLADWSSVREEIRRHFENLILGDAEAPDRGANADPGMRLETRLEAALGPGPLLGRLRTHAEPILERRAADASWSHATDPALAGLARVVASNRDDARFIALRPSLIARVSAADGRSLDALEATLETETGAPTEWDRIPDDAYEEDLESFLDRLRLLRRDAGVLAGVAELGGLASFERASVFLSRVAEAIVRRALAQAHHAAGSAASVGSTGPAPELVVVAMGKLAGRELTYHSDLDIIFLYEGDSHAVIETSSRVAQRLISYLTTMTGAGTAYAVDSRLRPSGHQGTLVTSFEAFERYQRETAATWEHLALMRSRVIAGAGPRAQARLDAVRGEVIRRYRSPWGEVGEMRDRVERERAPEGADVVGFKTGRGGLMEVDFLAAGGALERADAAPGAAVPELLRSAVRGARVDALLESYAFLRRFEARVRHAAGRAVESIDAASPEFAVAAALLDPHGDPEGLRARVDAAQDAIRTAYEEVLRAGSITALGSS